MTSLVSAVQKFTSFIPLDNSDLESYIFWSLKILNFIWEGGATLKYAYNNFFAYNLKHLRNKLQCLTSNNDLPVDQLSNRYHKKGKHIYL